MMDKIIGVIDDHPQTATSIARFLEFKGYKTFEANSLQEAKAYIEKEKPQLIIIDLVMENENVIDFIKRNNQINFITITNFIDRPNNAKNIKNIKGILEKPIDNLRLIETISSITSK